MASLTLMMTNIPNIISLLRLCMVPLIVWLILSNQIFEAFIVFLVAGFSDALDGFLARAFKAKTTLGSYLDPIADKALLVGVYVALGIEQMMPLWVVILVVFRDSVIIGGIILSFLLKIHLQMKPRMISKINTAVQIFYAAFILSQVLQASAWESVHFTLALVVSITTVLSGLNYVMIGLKRLNEAEEQ